MFFQFIFGKRKHFSMPDDITAANRLTAEIKAGNLDPNAKHPEGYPLLFVALSRKFLALLVTALQYGANPNIRLANGCRSLANHLFQSNCDPYLIRLLLSYGMNYDDIKPHLKHTYPYILQRAHLFEDYAEGCYHIHGLQVLALKSFEQGDNAAAIIQLAELKILLESRLAAERATEKDILAATEESYACVCQDLQTRIRMCEKMLTSLSPLSSDASEESEDHDLSEPLLSGSKKFN